MTTDLNTLLTALYVKIDDHLAGRRRLARPPKLTDAELVTLAVAQALLGFTSEARWLRFLPTRMPGAFRYLPCQSGYNRRPHPGEPLLKSIRQLIESVNDTLKGQLNLEQHGGRTIEGVGVRVAQRLLALTAAIWHNRATGQPVTRSLTAHDH